MDKDKAIQVTHTFLTSHINKLKKMSEETYIPVSALIRKALNEFFERTEKEKNK
jgi:hypothetical protein